MSLSITGCQTDISRRLGRPDMPSSCIANGDGTCFRNGQVLETVNMECMESLNIADMQAYINKIELELFICKKNRKKCPRL